MSKKPHNVATSQLLLLPGLICCDMIRLQEQQEVNDNVNGKFVKILTKWKNKQPRIWGQVNDTCHHSAEQSKTEYMEEKVSQLKCRTSIVKKISLMFW